MIRNLFIFISGILFLVSFCSCTPFHPNDRRAAICNELKSKIIFNGSTSYTRNADIQNSDQGLIQRAYEKNHCDER